MTHTSVSRPWVKTKDDHDPHIVSRPWVETKDYHEPHICQ